MKRIVLLAIGLAAAASASAQLGLKPDFGVKLGYSQEKASGLFAGIDCVLPAATQLRIRLDADAWTELSSFFKDRHGTAFSVNALYGLPVGYYGVGPAVINYATGGSTLNRIGAKLFAGARLPGGFVIEGNYLLTSGFSVGAIVVGTRF